ncbi:MAG: hypothetical protein JSU85_07070 [Candidatus Zixiibacteriota bacterium]|nr:MAG: hypothetical protein JSU85_07070 [candidate division Zixibacteria bacterium]
MKKLFSIWLVLLLSTFGVTANADITASNADAYNDVYETTNNAGIAAGEENLKGYVKPEVSFMPHDPIRGPAFLSKSNESPQWPSPLVENCPEPSLYGQDPYTPDDDWSAGTSDQGQGSRRYEFVYTSGQICDLHWWGLSLYWDGENWVNCPTEMMTFDIAFYEDAEGIPGNQLCFYDDIMPTMTGTLDLYNGNPLYRFDIDNLTPCCSITTAWVSIEGSSQSTPDCWFLWMGSASGDSMSLVWDGTAFNWFEHDLSICVTGTYIPVYGACCNDGTGSCIDDIEITRCPWPTARYVPNTPCANIQPPCGATFGACCDDQGNCTQTAEQDCPGLWLEETPCYPNPCPVPTPCTLYCPTNGIPEGEPDCYEDYDDTYNGGCNSDIPVFSTINIGDTICGTAGTFISHDTLGNPGNSRDTDWYALTITADAMLHYYGVGEFDLQLLVIDAGSQDCIDYVVGPGIQIEACSTGVISMPVTPGVYWLWAGTADFIGVACGSDYQIWAELGAAPMGACCAGTDCIATNTMSECAALQGNWYIGETCPGFDCPFLIDCDYAIWMNGLPTGNIYGSQCDILYPFAAGVADDFVLPGSTPVTLGYVIAWIGFWGAVPLGTPADCDGVNVTIYANDPANNAPGGKPLDPPDQACSHVELMTDGIVYTVQLAQGSFGYVDDGNGRWRFMMPVDVTLDAGVTYWLEVEPILTYDPYGQSGWIGTDIQQGAFAMQIFELLEMLVWTNIDPVTDVAFCLLEAPIGRCCYDTRCVDTTQAACDDLNGTWDIGLNCIDDPCPEGCDYAVGDVNGSGNYNGLDITYGVAYFKGGNEPLCPLGSCPIPPCDAFFYCGDVNGSCNYNGLDITYGVAYFKGGSDPIPCGDCPPIE